MTRWKASNSELPVVSKHLWVARSWIVCTLPAVSWIFLIFPVVSWIFIILRARSFLFSTWCQNDLEFSTSCTLIYYCFYHSIIKKNSWKHKQVWLARLARLVPCFLIKFALCLYEKGGLLRSWLKQPGSRQAGQPLSHINTTQTLWGNKT